MAWKWPIFRPYGQRHGRVSQPCRTHGHVSPHVKAPLVNYATIEMHQTDRVLRQFRFRQSIHEEPEVLDEQHKIDLRLTNMDWQDPWQATFAVEEQRRWQIHVERERRGPLNPRRRDDGTGPSIAPTQSPGPSTAPPTQLRAQCLNRRHHITTPSDYAKCAIVAIGIARDTIVELISLPFPIALWDSNTSAVGDADTSTFFILLRWVILPTPITGATTTPAGAGKEESSA
ncbi:hypothetical protein CXB51_001218 [Gossypium anomalum]|uniref:Uncharacterized protein n=1 Tax=Gossypium anomalum TaxID=47600 RepID=A0A8J5ZRN5_9ROSI|nr:hypothetical protein CXB51_001218 [Gossypium anomalum]